MGRYVPPEHEGLLSANQVSKKHALGSRARKSAQGILTVRFEMPFAIWCTTCPKPTIIGQGVRFNAEKKKVGNYHSTPVFSFRMKHNVCGGGIEIRTDPKNTAYVVTEGAKKRDTGDDKEVEGAIEIRTEEERERLRSDAFAALEVKVEDRRQQTTDKSRIEELYGAKDKDWEDPYAASKKLRRAFRADRKARQGREKITEALRERMGLGIELLEETEEDRRRAGFVEFGAQKAEELRKELGNNTRAVIDPFLSNSKSAILSTRPPIVLRKRDAKPAAVHSAENTTKDDITTNETKQPPFGLVEYDSD
ncbi:hypothetical protein G7Y79_00009g026990 [Physcia stellaris]|nr:hypothetical protein G7Y79_00009g026990 [Physcia stellaris]